MDKETLSNYGWIVICVLVLAVMIALATPFGEFIKDAVWSTTNGLFDVNENALNNVGISMEEVTKTNYTAQKLCIEHDLGVEMVYGENITYKGVAKPNENVKHTGYMPAEMFTKNTLDSSLNLVSYTIYDKDKNYIRGHYEMSNFSVDPSQGEAYVILNMSTLNVCCYMSHDIDISTPSKTFEIFGDSWSAFDTSIVEGRLPYYGETGIINDPVHGYENDMQSNSDMWYSVLEQRTGWKLVRNDSSSGSCMSYSYYGGAKDDPHGTSYITRMRDRFEGSGANLADPDVIFVFGGTNDYGAGAELGEVMYSGWTENDLNNVFPATCYILDYLKQQAPNSKVIFVLNYFPNNPDMMTGIKSICNYYGVDCVSWCNSTIINQQSSHPTKAGMSQIADQIIYDLDKKGII